MDPRRFDALARSLATPRTRRDLFGTIAALGAGLLGARGAGAQVTQATCGNVFCASNPGVCRTGCVCCVYTNAVGQVTNSRCRPPGTCSPGAEVGGGTPTTTVAPTTTTTTQSPTTTSTAVPTTTAAPTTTAGPTTTATPTTTTTTTGSPQCFPVLHPCGPGDTCCGGGTCDGGRCCFPAGAPSAISTWCCSGVLDGNLCA